MSAGWGPGGLFGEGTLSIRALQGEDLELSHQRLSISTLVSKKHKVKPFPTLTSTPEDSVSVWGQKEGRKGTSGTTTPSDLTLKLVRTEIGQKLLIFPSNTIIPRKQILQIPKTNFFFCLHNVFQSLKSQVNKTERKLN